MVKIINGEIVQDDDPRLQNVRQPSRPTQPSPATFQQFSGGRPPAAAAGGAPTGGRVAFDWNAPPFKLLPADDGRLPDVEVFGVAVPAIGLIGVAAAGLFLGWRGLLGGVIIGYLYLTNRSGAAAPGRRPARAAAAASNFLQQMQQGFVSESSSQAHGSRHQQGGGQQQSSSPWTGLGKGQKLGSAS